MTTKKSKTKTQVSKVDELEGQLARALADYDNLRKRVEREKKDFERLASVRLVVRLLPIFDMFEGAQKHLADSGLAITMEEFEKVLKEEGLEKVKVKAGDSFSEEMHEVIGVAGGKEGQGKITEVILSGWRLIDGQVIRPAKVKVGRKN